MASISSLLLLNLFASSILLICAINIVYYLGRVFQYRGKPKFLFYFSYLTYFIIMDLTSIGNILTLNFAAIWGVSQEYHALLEAIYKSSLLFASLGFTVLAIILKIESENPKTYRKRMLNFQILMGVIIIITTSLTTISVDTFENDIVFFNYHPPFTLLFLLAFILSIGLGYGVQSLDHYIKRFRKYRKTTPFHYLYLGITTLSFVIISIVVLYRAFLPTSSDLRALITNTIILVFVLLPTLRWMYLEQFEKNLYQYEKNTLLDVIAHDLTNINQILLNNLEFIIVKKEMTTGNKETIETLLFQVERMGKLIEEVHAFVQKVEDDLF